MPIQNPMNCVNPENRKRVLIILLILIILIFSIFRFLDSPLRTEAAPSGIVSFELAGSAEKTNQILASWDTRADLFAAFGLGFDFLCMVVYASTISLSCLMVSAKHTGRFSSLGTWLGWGAILAAILDSIENIALWNLLIGKTVPYLPQVAAWCASIKFTFILLGILYGLAGWLMPKKRA